MGKWTDYLPEDVYVRLADCRSTKADVQVLVNAMWHWFQEKGNDKRGYTKEDALVCVLEQLDDNSCGIDLTSDEYYELCK